MAQPVIRKPELFSSRVVSTPLAFSLARPPPGARCIFSFVSANVSAALPNRIERDFGNERNAALARSFRAARFQKIWNETESVTGRTHHLVRGFSGQPLEHQRLSMADPTQPARAKTDHILCKSLRTVSRFKDVTAARGLP